MEELLQEIFEWLPEGGTYYVLLGVAAFLESIIGVGMIVPGSLITVFAGFLALHGKGDIGIVMAVSAAGAVGGDVLSYILGARLGPRITNHRLLRRRRYLLHRAESFLEAHGGKSVFFGRFIGPLRGVIPFTAGCTRMSPLAFLLYVLVSGLLWGIVYPAVGYVGGASWQRVRVLSGRVGLLVALLALLFVLNALFWKRAAPRIAWHSARLWGRTCRAWMRVLETPAMRSFADSHPQLWRRLADRFSLQHGTGLYLTTGFLTSAAFAGIFLWITRDLAWIDRMDVRVYGLLGDLRHPLGDGIMTALALMAEGPVLVMLGIFILIWLILSNRDFSALIFVVGMSGGEVLIYLLHLFFFRPAPTPFVTSPPALFATFPSGHSFSFVLFAGLTIYFILGTYAAWQTRLKLVTAGSFLTLLVASSRVYLGLQWLSSVLAGFALAALWLTFLITAREMRRRYAGEFPWRTGWEPLHLSANARTVILAVVALAVGGGIVFYLLSRMRMW